MQIDGNSWHCKVYQWWYTHKYARELRKRNYIYDENGMLDVTVSQTEMNPQSNLCPYTRAVLLWAPVRAILWDWIKVGKVPLNAITIPAAFLAFPFLWNHHIRHALWIFYLLTLGSSAFIITVVGLLFLALKNQKWLKELLMPVAEQVVKVGPPVASFFQLLRAYLRSAHDRVCPEVTWNKK